MYFIKLDRKLSKSLTKQLYEQLQEKIISNEFPSNFKLPPSRTLANELHISRNLISEVYDTLKVEGYIYSKTGSGTFVSSNASFISTKQKVYESKITKEDCINNSTTKIIFETGIPEFLFPRGLWGRCLRDASITSSAEILGYGNNNGIPQFQKSIKRWLLIHKGINCLFNQILIFPGTHQSIDVLKKYFCIDNNQIIIEDPNLPSIRRKNLLSVTTDMAGLNIEKIDEEKNVSAVMVTPSHSYPLSQIMTIQRRIQLIQLAKKKNFYIIENDYDGELIYKGPIISSIYQLEPDKVIHLGSFSGTMYPSIKLSFMVVPIHLIEKISLIKSEMGFICPGVEQLSMTFFINNGYYDTHLLKLKKHFLKLYNFLVKLLKTSFNNNVEIIGIGAGQYIAARFIGYNFIGRLTDEIKERGLHIYYGYDCSIDPIKYSDIVILQFGKLDREQLIRGVKILDEVLSK